MIKPLQISNISPQLVRILIVEDEYIIAANLRENLESLNYQVLDIASTAEEAIAKATQLRPNLVLMDIRLQGEHDGIEAAEEIWQQLKIPVIYVTGHSDQSTLDRAKVTFPFGYLLKPVREKELCVAIETALSRYEREQFLSTILQRMGDGIVIVDAQSQIKYLNSVAETLTSWPINEARNQDLMTVLRLIDEDTYQAIENPVMPVLQTGMTAYLNRRVLLIDKDQNIRPITDSIAALMDVDGNVTGAVLVFRDDSQRRIQEEQKIALERAQLLELQMAEINRLNQLKDDFLSTVSHEMRTPLASIKMAIEMLEIVLNQDAPEVNQVLRNNQVRQYLEILSAQCDQELNLVNDLLEVQQIESGTYPLALSPVDLNHWIPHMLEPFEVRTITRQQTLQVTLSSDLPSLTTDLSLLTRILAELLTNACKYTPSGGQISVSVSVVENVVGSKQGDAKAVNPNDEQVNAPENVPENVPGNVPENVSENVSENAPGNVPENAPELSQSVEIIIRNTGVEIPANELPRVFDKFYRIPKSDRWKQGGTGLGLALIRKLTTLLGGNIRVESGENQVSFIVTLPLTLPT
ncbi:MAG: ATP-binding protein [Leptolyngbyaceae bacterium]|nr:ATP-binding protein [Leptolyngbyaceae bacterium]